MIEDYIFEVSDHDAKSEQSVSDTEDIPTIFEDIELEVTIEVDQTRSTDVEDISRMGYYYGKNKYEWSNQKPTRNTRT